ncbi:hypothetical protein KEH51_01300 [[Brevibacterium] frigoritolerans]|uniref:Uncharacterized protein n=1 Tax=Peribacillus frigoritolerans TaxID=450367 RepID=A0A941J9L3_9BACI|nr:hypothetical protein [Peribacillus frigoritolerans]
MDYKVVVYCKWIKYFIIDRRKVIESNNVFLIGSLDVQRGGLTKASLAQANTFAEMGYDTHILTFNFDTRYERIRSKLIELGQLNENVKVLNLYEELCGSEEDLSITQVTPETGYLDPHVGHNAFRVYENGLYTKYKKFHEDDSLDFIDYFNEQRYRVKKKCMMNMA